MIEILLVGMGVIAGTLLYSAVIGNKECQMCQQTHELLDEKLNGDYICYHCYQHLYKNPKKVDSLEKND